MRRRTHLLALVLVACTTTPPSEGDGGLPEADGGLGAGAAADGGAPADDAGAGDPCETVTCGAGEACRDGACWPRQCGARVCASTERCVDADAGSCVEAACVGVTCPASEDCFLGSCLSRACGGQTCPGATRCIDDVCVEPACAGVSCDGGACVAGQCQGATCGDAGVCASFEVCLGGRCLDARCAAVTCSAGFECMAGTCVAGCTPSAPTEARCGDGADDDCDGLVDCADADCASQPCADEARACTREVCAGGQCTHPAEAAGVTCRPSAGGCDLAESCDGVGAACPADVFDASCACPYRGPIAGFLEGDGLRAIAASAFALRDTGTWTANAAAIDAWGLPRVGLDVLPLNRTATRMASQPWPGFGGGFFWESGDLSVEYWVPQGLAGGVAGARSLIAVSWHYDEADNASDPNPPADGNDKGVRVSIADVTSLSAGVTYRHVLLVEPDAARGFKPVNIHAGGLAWSGSLLYVADTSRGLRVFDLSRVLQVSTAPACATRAGLAGGQACAYGYQYVVPQVGGYFFPTGLSASCRPRFSFVALDRSTTPDSLLSGEYDNDPAWGHYGRVLRWPLAAGSARLATSGAGVVSATGAWYEGNRNVQGAIASGPKFFLNSTRNSGSLFTGLVGVPATALRASNDQWGWMPEGMYISAAGNLWVSTEGHASLARSVYFVRAADVP